MNLHTPKDLARMRRGLLRWYGLQGRELPWRETRDPYRIWVSEIMLQQTRIAAALGHYARFLARFPNVQRLAAARPSSVLAAWSGLGYYRRARMLHAAAREVAGERNGIFPVSAAEWRSLPGVGRYTAAAIASIAYAEPVAVVDGNVERVLRRFHAQPALQGEALWTAAERLLWRRHPGDFNQAMMELGATVCLPKRPQCGACPLHQWCSTRGAQAAERKPRQKKGRLTYGLALRNGSVALVQRREHERLMPGMWELPPAGKGRPLAELRHSITSTDYQVEVRALVRRPRRAVWVPRRRLERLPLTGLARKILRHLAVI